MELSCALLLAITTPVAAAEKTGIVESLLQATIQRPWLWAVYVFSVGLPMILFISFMWPDKRFGPPDQQYYYKKSDDIQPDDPEESRAPKLPDLTDKPKKTVSRRKEAHGDQTKS